MSKLEQLELTNYPIWQRQDLEDLEDLDVFLRFEAYFLPLPTANLTEAYRRYTTEKGLKGKSDPPNSWRDDCERYRWRERWQAYRREQNQNNLAWLEEKRRLFLEQELATALKMISKANEVLDLRVGHEDRLKDSATLLRCGSDLGRKALALNNIDSAIKTLESAGFTVIDETSNQAEENNA